MRVKLNSFSPKINNIKSIPIITQDHQHHQRRIPHQSYQSLGLPSQSNCLARSSTPCAPSWNLHTTHPNLPLHSQLLSKFYHSLDNQDFESVIDYFDRLSFDQKSRLSPQTYNSIFSLASRTHAHHSHLNPSLFSHTHPEGQSYNIDYPKIHAQLIKLDQAFQSAQRSFSVEQLHSYLEITILAAALQLRTLSIIPSTHLNCSSSSTHQDFDSVFSQFHQHISSIIQRLPALKKISIPTAHQLAQAIPFKLLGLYSRFLVVFHRPNQGLKLIRKVYYAYLINRKIQSKDEIQHQMLRDCTMKEEHDDQFSQSESDTSVIETGSLIISLLRHKIHHRLAALKLAIRMITIGGIHPDPLHITSLLRRMYMSKSEWESVIQFQAELMTTNLLASNWLKNQIAIVEAEDGRVEKALSLSAEALKLPPDLQGDFLSPATCFNPDIFAHAIHALINHYSTTHYPSNILPSGLRGAIAIRAKMLESGFPPPPESDDLILRRICHDAQRIRLRFKRREFLKEMIDSMFPVEKIVPLRSDSLRSFKFQSHPGKSPEAFRLMRWLMRWNEHNLSLQVFQSLSRYGYVTSFTSVPSYYLKKILNKALYSHPELAMELYQHFYMSGSDRSGELFQAIQIKSIKMGDYQLASYLLKKIEKNHQDSIYQTKQISNFLIGFSNRKKLAGNVLKTLLLFEFVWNKWPNLIEFQVWKSISNHITRIDPFKLSRRPEVILGIEKFIQTLNQASKFLNISQIHIIEKEVLEFLEITKSFIQSSNQDDNNQSTHIINHHDSNNANHHQIDESGKNQHDSVSLLDSNLNQYEELVEEYLKENQVEKAVEVIKTAISLDILIRGPIMGKLLNRLIDDLLNEYKKNDDDDNEKKNDQVESNQDLNYFKKKIEFIFGINQHWRSMSWKFNFNQKGHDHLITISCIKLFNFLKLIDHQISL